MEHSRVANDDVPCRETSMSERVKRLVCEAAIATAGMLPVALLAYVLFQ
jgi:hypothetical protein